MCYLFFFLNFLFSFLCFSFLSFFFSFTLFSFFYSVNTLFFDPFLRTRQGSYYSACRGQFLPLCLLTTFVWSRRTCRPPKVCDTHPCQTKAGLFHSLVHRSTLSCHGINAFSLFPSRHAPNGSPFNLASFGWSVILAGRTSQKSLAGAAKIGLFPSPHHQTIPPLPLTFGPWPHHVPYWLGTGWWCLGLARAFLSDMSKSLPAAYAFVVIWRLSVRVF